MSGVSDNTILEHISRLEAQIANLQSQLDASSGSDVVAKQFPHMEPVNIPWMQPHGQDWKAWVDTPNPTSGCSKVYAFEGYQSEAQANALTITIESGKCYIAGVDTTITNLAATQLMTAAGTRYNYVKVDLDAATATYYGDAASIPANTDVLEHVGLHEVTSDASKVTLIKNLQCGDIRIPRTGG